MAQVTITFNAWKQGNVALSHQEIEVVTPKSPLLKLEPVSWRLKRSFVHPNRTGYLSSLRYSPDGKRIIAGDFPDGMLQVWDTQTGKQLTRIATDCGHAASDNFFCLAPDWKTVFVPRYKRKTIQYEKDGKKFIRWQFERSALRAWDLSNGELRNTFKPGPGRGIYAVALSPDGSGFVTFELLSGESEQKLHACASLWDLKSKQFRSLSGEICHWAVYSPDGKTLAAPAETENGRSAVKLFDVVTAREKFSIPIAEQEARRIGLIGFSPDGRLLVGTLRDELKNERHWLKFWEPATGKEVGSFEGEKKAFFIDLTFSLHSRTLAVNTLGGKQGKLFLFDLSSRKLIKTIVLGDKARVA